MKGAETADKAKHITPSLPQMRRGRLHTLTKIIDTRQSQLLSIRCQLEVFSTQLRYPKNTWVLISSISTRLSWTSMSGSTFKTQRSRLSLTCLILLCNSRTRSTLILTFWERWKTTCLKRWTRSFKTLFQSTNLKQFNKRFVTLSSTAWPTSRNKTKLNYTNRPKIFKECYSIRRKNSQIWETTVRSFRRKSSILWISSTRFARPKMTRREIPTRS